MGVVEMKYKSKLSRQQTQLEGEMKSKLKEKEVDYQLKESEFKNTIKLKDNQLKDKATHLKVYLFDIVLLPSDIHVFF